MLNLLMLSKSYHLSFDRSLLARVLRTPSCSSNERTLLLSDPLGQAKVTAGFAHVVRSSVRPHFSNLEKQNNRKQCSLLA